MTTPNTGVIQGQDLVVMIGSNVVAHGTSCTLNPSLALRDRKTKDTGVWMGKVAGTLSWECSTENLACYDGHSFDELFTALVSRVAVTIKFTGRPASVGGDDSFTPQQTGDKYYEGSGFITGLPLTAPNDADATFTCSISGSGKLESKAVAGA